MDSIQFIWLELLDFRLSNRKQVIANYIKEKHHIYIREKLLF